MKWLFVVSGLVLKERKCEGVLFRGVVIADVLFDEWQVSSSFDFFFVFFVNCDLLYVLRMVCWSVCHVCCRKEFFFF